MDGASAQVASALARVERSIIELIAEQGHTQDSIAQLRNDVADSFGSHQFEPRPLSGSKQVSAPREMDSVPQSNKNRQSNLLPEGARSKRTVHQIGNHTSPLEKSLDESSYESKLQTNEQNLVTFLHSPHDTRFGMLSDSGGNGVEVTQTYHSSLDPNWPATLTVRPCWESLPKGTEVDASSLLISTPHVARFERIQNNTDYDQRERVFLPGSLKRLMLDLIGMTLLMWDIAFTPVEIAWSLNIEGWLLVVTVCVSSFWTLDIMFSSRTAYYRTSGDLETRPLQVLLHYLRGQFIIDLAVVVADWMSYLVESFPGVLSLVRITKATRLARLLRVARLLRIANLRRLNELEDVLNSYGFGRPLFETVKITLFTAFLTHIFSCLWFMIGNLRSSDTGYHWVGATWASSSPTFLNTSISFQYCSALQWTLSTMISGSTSILALNSTEQIYSCFMILIGLLFQAFVVSILSAVAVESNERQRHLAASLTSLNRFCKAHKVTKQISLIARSQTRAAANRKANANLSINDVDGLLKIGSKVRTLILREAFEPHLSTHELFYLWSHADKSACSKVFNGAMDFLYVHSGMDVFMANETATGAYLLSRGKALYVQEPHVSKVLENTEEYVLLDTWLAEAALWTEWLHVGTLEAVCEECEVCCLSFEGLLVAIQSCTKIKDLIGAYAQEYQQRLVKAVPPLIPWPSDLGTLGDEFMQILPALPERVRKAFAFMALDCATRMDLIGDAQLDMLVDEINKGKSNVVLVKCASQPSLQRLVSVVRVSVKRDDGAVFAHLGKIERERFAPKCELPGAKIGDHEDMGTTADRIVKTLKQHIDNIEFKDCGVVNEFGTSHKTLVPTYYSIVNVSYVSSPRGCSQSENTSFARQRRKTLSSLIEFRRHRRDSTIESSLDRRLRGQTGLVTIEYDDYKAYLCMWLQEEEFQFLKSKDGVALLQSLSNAGVLQRQLMPDMRLCSTSVYSADLVAVDNVLEQEAPCLTDAHVSPQPYSMSSVEQSSVEQFSV